MQVLLNKKTRRQIAGQKKPLSELIPFLTVNQLGNELSRDQIKNQAEML